MWPLVYSARERPLAPAEAAELRRLAELVKRGSSNRPEFNERADALCEAVATRVLTESAPASGNVEPLLEEIDQLREILES
jgi:hypothetical protein